MPFAKPIWNTKLCNRHCMPLLKCPKGSHINKSHTNCVWHNTKSHPFETKSEAPVSVSSSEYALPTPPPKAEELSTPEESSAPDVFFPASEDLEQTNSMVGGVKLQKRSGKKTSHKKRSGKKSSLKKRSVKKASLKKRSVKKSSKKRSVKNAKKSVKKISKKSPKSKKRASVKKV